MAEIDLLKKSVTAGDYSDTPRGGVINFMIPWYPGASATGLPPEPPQWWSRARDYTLRSTVLYEDMWKAAIGIAITKAASTSWEVDSEVPLRARRGQNILNDSGWFKLLAMGLRDYLTTDNGQFIEIVRVTKSPVSMAIGLAHLDSIRCTRTGDPEIPLIYTDRKGREHEVKYENVIMLSDMPDPGDTWFGVGTCAASGAFRSIYKLSVIERYVSEKVSGRRPLAIHFVSAVGQRQLDGIVQSAEEHAARQGLLSYMGAIVVPLLDASVPPQVSTVPLAELPDRFNRKEEYDIALYSYAANIGLDIQDLQPLTGQPLGTGAQSQVLDEKAKGKGLVYWKKEFPSELNLKVFDDMTTFAFIEKDYRDQERQAAISNARATTSKTRIDAGITTADQELQVLVDLDELPNEFLSEDVTGETLSDTEKPDKEEAGEGEMVEEPQVQEEKPQELAQEEQLMTKKGGEGSGNFGHAGRPGEVGGSSSEGGKEVPDYFYSKDARTLPPEIDNRLDGGPGKSIQYHGSPQKGITEFGTNEVYLQDNPEEAKGYSAGRHMMQNKKGGEILQVRRKPGKTLNLDPELLRRMDEGDDPDDVINEYINPAKERGFRYIYFEHPTFSGEGSQKVIISLFPKDDLKIVGRVRNKEAKDDNTDLDKLYLQELNEAVKLYQDAGGEMPETPGMKERLKEVVLRWFKADEKDEEDEDPGPFKTARQRKWFFSQGPGTEGGEKRGNSKIDRTPKKRTPAGTPLSNGLVNKTKGKTKVAVDEAMNAIDSVHGDGNLPTIPVNQSAGQKTTGQFAYNPYTGESLYINISSRADTPMCDFTHEVGHYINFNERSKDSSIQEARQQLSSAISGSSAYQQLQEYYTNPKSVELEFGDYRLPWKPESSYVRYLLNPGELFARSYSQYIATRSGNDRMLTELHRQQSNLGKVYLNQSNKGGGYPAVWEDDDFKNIATAYDNYFAAVGWTQ